MTNMALKRERQSEKIKNREKERERKKEREKKRKRERNKERERMIKLNFTKLIQTKRSLTDNFKFDFLQISSPSSIRLQFLSQWYLLTNQFGFLKIVSLRGLLDSLYYKLTCLIFTIVIKLHFNFQYKYFLKAEKVRYIFQIYN